jgi:hypothetical protein
MEIGILQVFDYNITMFVMKMIIVTNSFELEK